MKSHSAPDKEKKPYRISSAYIASATAGVIQTSLFHPLDTITKRLQTQGNVRFNFHNVGAFAKNLKQAIYPVDNSSVWRGLSAALTYRVSVCTIAFGTQPSINRHLNIKYGDKISQLSGQKYKSTVTNALAASVFGMVDVAFLPLDRWKVLRQLNNTTPFMTLLNAERNRLFAGAAVTSLRNIQGYATLFGVSDFVKINLFTPNQDGTQKFYQTFTCAFAGSIASVAFSNPADVVKTCLQSQNNDKNFTGLSASGIAKKIYSQNGIQGFARGAWPRLFSIVPRLTLLKSLSEQLTPLVDERLNHLSKKKP